MTDWEITGPATGDLQGSVDMNLVYVDCDKDISFSDRQASLAIRDSPIYLDQYFVGYTFQTDGYFEFYIPLNGCCIHETFIAT
ncbi:MAG TPA: hypothetical protein DFR83_08110 [Deltaproteobacteria bacterium]|nr:hypothetical protein [Deltaproteobacteria bacterium]